ncbi:MAG: glycosyltransferase family 2 protein [Dehalococcoidia bacterium]|nr:glycosyltransferase family 2 protein [Dehalococcoidia bacterium]
MKRTASGQWKPRLSVIIPVLNEVESIPILHRKLGEVLAGEDYEVIFVDDGSTDGSFEAMEQLRIGGHRTRIVRFGRNFGKSSALDAGFRVSRGEIIITMDSDLQDDPEEIPRLLATLGTGYDLVSGWKTNRQDPLTKTFPSLVFNRITAAVTGIDLHDFNCGFKVYHRRLVDNLHIYGELHRFIPALAYWRGFRVTEIGVRHHTRKFGRSKFGAGRFLSGFLDLFTVLFLTRFNRKPLHLFGSMGLLCLGVGLAINIYLTVVKLAGEAIGTRPLLQLGILLMVMGLQFFSMGLLADLITVLSHKQENEALYEVREPEPEEAESETGHAP